MRLWLVTACAALLLSGCTTRDLQTLRQLQPAAALGEYQQALVAGYRQLAEDEAAAYDWIDSQFFAQKGLKAARGDAITPVAPAQWDVPLAMLPELESARAALVAAVAAEQGTAAERAEAVVTYDCWVEQQEEGWQVDQIVACRDRFDLAIGALTAPPPAPKLAEEYVVYFPYAVAHLTPQAQQLVNQMLSRLPDGPFEVVLYGHADRSGSELFNQTLSERRAQKVQGALLAGGLQDAQVSYLAFGESDPAVPTADGVQEPLNRRVEVFLELLPADRAQDDAVDIVVPGGYPPVADTVVDGAAPTAPDASGQPAPLM